MFCSTSSFRHSDRKTVPSPCPFELKELQSRRFGTSARAETKCRRRTARRHASWYKRPSGKKTLRSLQKKKPGDGRVRAQFAERKTEPNSGLGKAITYLLRHWRPLTLFLRIAGAPVDNNIVERALKRAVLHRKNALFYRTLHGAQVGDLFMSLIHTCQLCGVNSFDYLIELQRHAQELAAHPAGWTPWSYRETLALAGVS
jgi:hypothetical protein